MDDRDAFRKRAMETYWADLRAKCREDVNTFLETVFRDDQTPGSPPFKQQWFHCEWQAAWRTKRIAVIHGGTGLGKTEQAVGHLLWRMGRNPSTRILIVSKSEDKAKELLAKIKRQIEHNETLRSIFPELRPGDPWGAESIRLATAGIDTTTNTVTIYGINAPKAGPRADIILCDDINDNENTRTEERRAYVLSTVESVLISRLTTNGQLFILANAWHPDDVAFTFKRRAEGGASIWYGCYPAILPSGEPIWPDFRPLSWLDEKRRDMSPVEFARMYLCQPRDEGTRIFKTDWFDLCKLLGKGLKPIKSIKHHFDRDGRPTSADAMFNPFAAMQKTMRVVVGQDVSSGKTQRKRKSDFGVLFTLGVRPDTRRQVMWIEKGRWDLGASVARMRDHEQRYRPDLFAVEDNGVQSFLIEHARGVIPNARIEPFTTTGAKWDVALGIEAIGTELMAGAWVIPDPDERLLDDEEKQALECIRKWQEHLIEFSRDAAEHTHDDVMASWFAQRRARTLDLQIISPTVEQQAPVDHFAAQFPPLQPQDDPYVPPHIRDLFGV